MSALKATRTAQRPLVASFVWNFDDTMLDTGGVSKDFGATNIASTVFEVVNLPVGAIVTGGSVVTETAFDAATYTVSIGDSGSATRYLGATDVKSAGRTALVPTGYRNTGGLNIRATVVPADACTTGKLTLLVEYIIDGKSEEVTPV